jgi:Protein of unknown function (DUF3987)
MLDHIPEELKKLPQWVTFDVEGGKKIPYTPGTDSHASSNRPRDWRSFRAACADVESGRRHHVGFCFSSSDPYVFLDLDEPENEDQTRVFQRIASYSQRSVGGEGAHIICKGTFKGSGKHPAFPAAGLFKENRFCVMTGDVLLDRATINAVDDEDLQAIHSWLGGGHGKEEIDLVDYKPELPDMTVFQMGCDRFHKFYDITNGDWQHFDEFHNDHSSADHALIAMLCDLTESNGQVRWLFAHSGMWNEERAAKKAGHGLEGYVNRTIRKIRSEQAREHARNKIIQLDFSETPSTEIMETLPEVPARGDNNLIESLPPGLIRDIARYSYRSSYLPLQEASLLGSLMLFSGLTGRGYLTPTKSGLNQWLILVGGTSCGKDEYQNGMKRLINAVAKQSPSIKNIFGGEIVSGPGIETVFQDTFRYISYIPEFGDTFKLLANPAAPEYVKTLSRGLLNSYNSAGLGGSSEGRRKAKSDEERVCIERPCLCVAGEATPESLYGAMTTRELATGFLQRFTLLDVPAESWSLDENPHHGAKPPSALVERLSQLALMMDTADVTGAFTVVEASKEADDLLKNYRRNKRLEIMRCPEGLAKKEIINRAGLKAVRLASLLAVSSDYHNPRIELEHARWAIDFVEQTDAKILARFSTGEIGSGQVKQELEILQACARLSKLSTTQREDMGMNHAVAKEPNLVPLDALKAMVVNNSVFATDRLGAVTAFEKVVESLCKGGALGKITADYAAENFDFLRGTLLSLDMEKVK